MKTKIVLSSLLLCTLLLFAACGNSGSNSGASGSGSGDQAIPTPTQIVVSSGFQAVGEQTVITQTEGITGTSAVTTESTVAANVDLSVGERAYTKNKCGDCHGAKGEGVTDKGKAIAGTALSFDDFAKVVSTGGGLGNTHIFGRSAVSPKGMEALYAYVKSLK
ncbi:MAG: cytochrome c [Caldilineaceae bacterium]